MREASFYTRAPFSVQAPDLERPVWQACDRVVPRASRWLTGPDRPG